MNKDSDWYKRMRAKYGSDKAITAIMRTNSNRSKRNQIGTGGFAKLSPEKRKEISKRGVEARNAIKSTAEGQSSLEDQ